MLSLLTLLLAVQAAPKPPAGTVTLPLRDYLALVEKVEELEAAGAAARANAEPAVAELVSQHLGLTLGEGDAQLTARYEVEVRGDPARPVLLPLAGMASRIDVEPAGAAAVHMTPEGLSLVAPAPGRYRVTVVGRAAVSEGGGVDSVALAPMPAPVSELTVSLPTGRTWRCSGTAVAEDEVREGRRHLRLALPRGKAGRFETRRELHAGDTPEAVASAVVVTLIGLAREGLRRHDVVLYEVARGELSALSVTLPVGLEVERVASDEGEAVPWIEGRSLRVERTKKLGAASSGYLAVASSSPPREAVPLDSLTPSCKVRARYVAVASDVAAGFAPAPEASFTRVDLTDLPAPVHEAALALGLVAAWRAKGEEAPGRLAVAALPAPPMLRGLVHERETLTLLTVEGTLLHRDRFTVAAESGVVELALPPNATLWSSQVDEVPVRPIERAGRTVVPLGVAPGAAARVEIVVVETLAVPRGRSEVRLAPPELPLPVLTHEWRLLLPARNRYRLVESDLDRSSGRRADLLPLEQAAAGGVVGGVVGGRPGGRTSGSTATGPGGECELFGSVVDSSGAAVPGATVELVDKQTGRSWQVTSDGAGHYTFLAMRSGNYRLRASLPGFKNYELGDLRLARRETRHALIHLEVGAVTESVEVSAPSASASSTALDDHRRRQMTAEKAQREAELVQEYQDQVGRLKQGLVGGVKPLPVAIPETGKVLALAGLLPPARVSALLQVKAPKK